MTLVRPPLPADGPVSVTVYSVVWPSTEALVRRCLMDEAEQMLDAHRDAFTKRQDRLHDGFFAAWNRFSAPAVSWGENQFPETYPTAGSSEAIREIIREAAWKREDLVVFDGDYEGYEAIAQAQGTRVHRIARAQWEQTLDAWRQDGVPWGEGRAQFWLSQPSAIDGNVWPDFDAWLTQMSDFADTCRVWVDLTYVGRARLSAPIVLSDKPAVAGVVFSLSKVMGAYYRRIGGCFSREPLAGLWSNRWFKNLDSLYLGQRWLEQAGDAVAEGNRYPDEQSQALQQAMTQLGGSAWEQAGVTWRESDVSLLIYATPPEAVVPELLSTVWEASGRGTLGPVSRRLCLSPLLSRIVGCSEPSCPPPAI